jgi:phosphoenolpyruvate synthase/pyruvate phosphate dikinase
MSLAIPLEQIRLPDSGIVGGKAAALAQLIAGGTPVPGGLCVSTLAYRHYLTDSGLDLYLRRELRRKPFEDMRWEELWDTALRIRNMFLNTPLPEMIRAALVAAIEERFVGKAVVVRSSAPGEDTARASFAGLHESFVNVGGTDSILDHIRLVWASLWSDRALLYRQELALDVASSDMAVVVQEFVDGERSGVAFSQSPTNPAEGVVAWKLRRTAAERLPMPWSASPSAPHWTTGRIGPRKSSIPKGAGRFTPASFWDSLPVPRSPPGSRGWSTTPPISSSSSAERSSSATPSTPI